MKSWWRPFQSFLQDKKNMTWDQMETTTEFRTMLRLFLENLRRTRVNLTITFSVIFFLMLTTQSSNSTLNLLGILSVTALLLLSSQLKWSYSKENSYYNRIQTFQSRYGMSSSLPPPSEYLPAKAKVDQIIAEANISSKSFASSPVSKNTLNLKIIFY